MAKGVKAAKKSSKKSATGAVGVVTIDGSTEIEIAATTDDVAVENTDTGYIPVEATDGVAVLAETMQELASVTDEVKVEIIGEAIDEIDDEDAPKTKVFFEPKSIVAIGAKRFDEFDDVRLSQSKRKEKVEEMLRILDEHDADERKTKAEVADYNSRKKNRESDVAEIRHLLRKGSTREMVAKWRIEGWRFIDNAPPEILVEYVESSKIDVVADASMWLIFDSHGKIIERTELPASKMRRSVSIDEAIQEALQGDETESLPVGFEGELSNAETAVALEKQANATDDWDDATPVVEERKEALAAMPDTSEPIDDMPF